MMEEEYVDLVNELDEVVGRVKRNKVYSESLKYMRYSNIFLLNEKEEILMPKRDANREIYPNCYDFSCAEGVISGESYEEAAKRGLKEELCLQGVGLTMVKKFLPKEGVSNPIAVFVGNIKGQPNFVKTDCFVSTNFFEISKIKEMLKSSPELFKSDYEVILNELF